MKRRCFLKGCAALAAAGPLLSSLACAQITDPTRASVLELRAALDSGKLSSEGLMRAYLARVERWNPSLNAIIEINPEALSLATKWDKGPKTGQILGGIPVLLKDNIATADDMVTSAGSAALANSKYPTDSGIARQLREAGAILMGKANMSEWANFRSNNSTGGWSARGGQCRNPHVLDRSPSGSSSGSAAAVAAFLAPLAVGTETIGSVVGPSGICGIVGLKPTAGLLPGDGIIPIATSWDTAGPMGRSVADVALLMGALSPQSTDYTTVLKPGGLKGARIGVGRSFFGFDFRVDALMEEQLKILQELGAVLVDPVSVPSWRDLGPPASLAMLYEFKAGLNAYLQAQAPEVKVRSLAEVIAFNRANPELEAMDFLGQGVLLEAEAVGRLTEKAYLNALESIERIARREGLEKTFADHSLDAILGPSNGPAWKIDLVNGDHFEGGSAAPAAVGGYPHITVPAGFLHQLPIGLSLFGPKNSERRLLSLAYDYEQATKAFREPKFLEALPSP